MGIKMGLHIRGYAANQNTLVQVHLSETFLSLVLFSYGLCLLFNVLVFSYYYCCVYFSGGFG